MCSLCEVLDSEAAEWLELCFNSEVGLNTFAQSSLCRLNTLKPIETSVRAPKRCLSYHSQSIRGDIKALNRRTMRFHVCFFSSMCRAVTYSRA